MCLPAVLTKGTTETLVNLFWTSSSPHADCEEMSQTACFWEDAGRLPLLPSSWYRTNSKLRYPLYLLKCFISFCSFSFSIDWAYLKKCRHFKNTNLSDFKQKTLFNASVISPFALFQQNYVIYKSDYWRKQWRKYWSNTSLGLKNWMLFFFLLHRL